MKKVKRILSLVFAFALLLGCLAGCGGNNGTQKGEDPANEIKISYWNSGLGTQWLDAMIAAFEAEHPEYKVTYNASADAASVLAPLGLPEVDTNDIYMGIRRTDTENMEPLDDLLTMTAEGDTKTLGEKFDTRYLNLERDGDGHYYGFTYGGGVVGIVYNKEMFAAAGVDKLPRTTDELAVVCDTIYSNGQVALLHYQPAGYWEFMTEVWMSQYDGMDYYLNNLYACKDADGNSPSKAVFTAKDGRYQTLLAYEKFITPEYVLSGSNSMDYITAQTMFINGSAAMMVSGSWMQNEMAGVGKMDNFEMMKTPVISSITDRLTTVKGESALRKLIDAIDSVADGEKKLEDYAAQGGYQVDGTVVSQEDWDIVYEARYSIAVNYSAQPCVIPNYSNNKEGAKEFLKFMYSDKGIQIYQNTLHFALPISLSLGTIDTSSWSGFEKGLHDMMQSAACYVSSYNGSKHRIYSDGGATPFCGVTFVNSLCARSSTDRLSADAIWEKMMKEAEKLYDDTWLANIK